MDRIDRGLFRIRIPFETLTTTVYLYVCPQGAAIIDSATYPADVDTYILPALPAASIQRADVRYLLLTHAHSDHMGGIGRLAELFPDAAVGTSFAVDLPNRMPLTDGQNIIGDLFAVHLPGHTENIFAFYDAATKTLLSGDCLQLNGIGKYRNGVCFPLLYIDSVNKLKKMGLKRIVAAHEYDPLGSVAEGEAAVERYLDECIRIIQAAESSTKACPQRIIMGKR